MHPHGGSGWGAAEQRNWVGMKKGSGFLEGRQGNKAGLGVERTDSGPEVLIFSWFCFVFLSSLKFVP